MSLTQEVDILRRMPLFADVEPSKLKFLAFASELVSFEPGQYLMQEGQMGTAAFIVLEGKADVLVETETQPIKIATVAANQITGELALLCDRNRTASVRATEHMKALKIHKDLFFKLITEFPGMATAMMRDLASRLDGATAQVRLAHQEIHQLKSHTAQDKDTAS